MNLRRAYFSMHLAIALLLPIVLLLPASAHAATLVYIGPFGGDWNTPTNWSGGVVPGPEDTAVIGGTHVTINATPPNPGSLQIGGSTRIDVPAGRSLTVESSMTISAPSPNASVVQLFGPGSIGFLPGATLTIALGLYPNHQGQLQLHQGMRFTLPAGPGAATTWTSGSFSLDGAFGTTSLVVPAGATFPLLDEGSIVAGTVNDRLVNHGTVVKSGPGVTFFHGQFLNSGLLDMQEGILRAPGGLFPLSQDAGRIVLGSAAGCAEGVSVGAGETALFATVTMNGGTLEGDGGVAHVTNNGGTVDPGAADERDKLCIHGNYTQAANGTLRVDVNGTALGSGGPTGYDRLTVGGVATLDGTLAIVTDPSFVPQQTDVLSVLTRSSGTGTFGTVTGAATPAGTYEASYAPTQVNLGFVPNPPSADLRLFKSDSADPVTVGEPLTYNLTVFNLGPDAASGVQVTDTLPAGVTFVSADPTQGSCSQAGGIVSCDLGSLASCTQVLPGNFNCDLHGRATVTIQVSPTAQGTITNTASVSSSTADPHSASNSDSENTLVQALPANLSLVKSDSADPVGVGGTLIYTLDVANAGPGDASGVQVTDTLPARVTFASADPSQGSCSLAAATVTCDLGSLASGSQATVLIEVTADSAGTITNSASVSASNPDPGGGNNSDSEETLVGADTDGDALHDSWETNGVDVDSDGSIDLDLPAMGADPMHKDIFVEIDYMPGHEVSQAAVDLVVAAFAAAPVTNPDGVSGVALHVDNGPMSIMNPSTGETWGGRSDADTLAHQDVLGSSTSGGYNWSAFDAVKAANFSSARARAFHYAVSGHGYGSTSNTSTGISRGIGASDFLVTFRSEVTPPDDYALGGTLMHELGHNLDLRHGGGNNTNYKPGYLSVMNYPYQFGLRLSDSPDRLLDYSRFEISLDENALDENNGFGFPLGSGPAAFLSVYRCVIHDPFVFRTASLLAGPVNWNCVGGTGGVVAADVNRDGAISVLAPFLDWPALVYGGGAIGDAGASVQLPETTEMDEPQLDELLASQHALDEAQDTTAPELTVPADMTVDATIPAGATVSYSATATDDVDLSPTVECVPASGSVFPIGTSTVNCTATDDAGNSATGKFRVTVRSAAEQIVRLIDKTLVYVGLPALEAALKARLQAAADALIAKKKALACSALKLYIAAVNAAPPALLTAEQKNELVGDANRIRAVIGC